MTADAVGATFAALADPTRRHVIDMLADREAVTASELARDLPITRQAVSKHLATLADAGPRHLAARRPRDPLPAHAGAAHRRPASGSTTSAPSGTPRLARLARHAKRGS